MTWLDITHLLTIIALAIGAGQMMMPKGTSTHRRWGLTFVFVMLISNTIAFGIYEDDRGIKDLGLRATNSTCGRNLDGQMNVTPVWMPQRVDPSGADTRQDPPAVLPSHCGHSFTCRPPLLFNVRFQDVHRNNRQSNEGPLRAVNDKATGF